MSRRRSAPREDRSAAARTKNVGTCPDCGKMRYLSRQDARRGSRLWFPGDRQVAYRCGDYWHFGHNFRK